MQNSYSYIPIYIICIKILNYLIICGGKYFMKLTFAKGCVPLKILFTYGIILYIVNM